MNAPTYGQAIETADASRSARFATMVSMPPCMAPFMVSRRGLSRTVMSINRPARAKGSAANEKETMKALALRMSNLEADMSLKVTARYKLGEVPESYTCSNCAAHGVKLWRQYQTFLNHIELMCADCAVKDQKESISINEDGRHNSDYGWTDQIGGMVPAVPTNDGSFWGYTSVPQAGVVWWRQLPLRPVVPSSSPEPARRERTDG